MPQPDSDDEFPDDIGHLDLSNVPGLQELPVVPSIRVVDDDSLRSAVPAASSLQLRRSSLPSEYDCDDEVDESILAACDALEAQYAQGRHRLEGQSIVNSRTFISNSTLQILLLLLSRRLLVSSTSLSRCRLKIMLTRLKIFKLVLVCLDNGWNSRNSCHGSVLSCSWNLKPTAGLSCEYMLGCVSST